MCIFAFKNPNPAQSLKNLWKKGASGFFRRFMMICQNIQNAEFLRRAIARNNTVAQNLSQKFKIWVCESKNAQFINFLPFWCLFCIFFLCFGTFCLRKTFGQKLWARKKKLLLESLAKRFVRSCKWIFQKLHVHFSELAGVVSEAELGLVRLCMIMCQKQLGDISEAENWF